MRISWLRDGPESLVPLFRDARPTGLTKAELTRVTGLSRTAISQRIDALMAAGYLTRVEEAPGSTLPGRPAERYVLSETHGITLVADTGATGMRIAVCSPLGEVLIEEYHEIEIARGPVPILDSILDGWRSMRGAGGYQQSTVLAVGLSVPGPVDHVAGRVVRPPIMIGWDGFDIVSYLQNELPVPVIVEKDASAMAIGDFRARADAFADNMVFVKIGTGVGTGIIIDGQIYRGSDGAAGDIGHVPLHGELTENAPVCRCGKVGCVEAYASGWALARDLTAAGHPATSVRDVIDAVHAGDPTARALVHRSATIIGTAVGDIVNMLNPRMVTFGGQLAELDDLVLATVREVIYGRSLSLATRNLQITSAAAPDIGVLGLAQILADYIHSPEVVNDALTV